MSASSSLALGFVLLMHAGFLPRLLHARQGERMLLPVEITEGSLVTTQTEDKTGTSLHVEAKTAGDHQRFDEDEEDKKNETDQAVVYCFMRNDYHYYRRRHPIHNQVSDCH